MQVNITDLSRETKTAMFCSRQWTRVTHITGVCYCVISKQAHVCSVVMALLCDKYVTKLTSLPQVIWEEGSVATLLHIIRRKVPIGYNGAHQIRPQKVPLSVDRSPNLNTCLIPGLVRPMTPNGIRFRSVVFLQCTGQTDVRTYARTQ